MEHSESEPLTIREALFGVHTRVQGTDMETIPEYPHLKFSNIEHYRETLAFAEKLGGKALDSFKQCLADLERWQALGYYGTTADVHKDVAEHSFYFRTYDKEGKCHLDGGIIFFGRTGEGYWSINT